MGGRTFLLDAVLLEGRHTSVRFRPRDVGRIMIDDNRLDNSRENFKIARHRERGKERTTTKVGSGTLR